MLRELLREPGVEERVELRSSIGLMALHGGSLERMTEPIAADTAHAAEASLYTVAQPRTLRWHVPSTRFEPTASRALGRFLAHIEVAVSVHGYGADAIGRPAAFAGPPRPVQHLSRSGAILLGGRNRSLAEMIARRVRDAFPGLPVVDDLPSIPAGMRGLHPANPVNRPPHCGVQMELPPRVRGYGPSPFDASAVKRFTDVLAGALREWASGT